MTQETINIIVGALILIVGIFIIFKITKFIFRVVATLATIGSGIYYFRDYLKPLFPSLFG